MRTPRDGVVWWATAVRRTYGLHHREVMRARLRAIQHPSYARIATIGDVRTFMEHDVFAAWGHAVLERRLAAELGKDDRAGDRVLRYRLAMEEVGADTSAIDAVVRAAESQPELEGLDAAPVPEPAKRFLRSTVGAHARPHEVLAAYYYGCQTLVPDLCRSLRGHLEPVLPLCPGFAAYLDDQVADATGDAISTTHARLRSMTRGRRGLAANAREAGVGAIQARVTLSDGILAEMRSRAVGAALAYPGS